VAACALLGYTATGTTKRKPEVDKGTQALFSIQFEISKEEV